MKILSLDPGGTTGYALWWSGSPGDVFQWGQVGPQWHGMQLWNLLSTHSVDLVICEAFNYQRREVDRGVQLNITAKEYIGITKLWCAMQKRDYLEYQPGQAKKLITDQYLRALNQWPTNQKHAADAMRQLVYHMVNKMGRRDLIPRLPA